MHHCPNFAIGGSTPLRKNFSLREAPKVFIILYRNWEKNLQMEKQGKNDYQGSE